MKVTYNNIKFDSDLEVNYYKHLEELLRTGEVVKFMYHPISLDLDGCGTYTPDFIVEFKEEIKVIETKGYNQFSFMRDNMIHKYMTVKQFDTEFMKQYVSKNSYREHVFDFINKPIRYQKIKYNKANGFVDWSFKGRKAIDNARDKIKELEAEIKELQEFKKNCIKYWKYKDRAKLTEPQKKAIASFLSTIHEELDK